MALLLSLILGVDSQQQSQQYRSSRESPLLKTFGCVKKRNIFVVSSLGDNYERLLQNLDDPCHTLFYFTFHEKRFVHWKYGEDSSLQFINHQSIINLYMSNSEYLEVIENLHNQQFNGDSSTKQIFLIEFTGRMMLMMEWNRDILNALLALDQVPQWSVIMHCERCPPVPGFPLNRIIPSVSSFDKNDLIKLIDLVKNPNFNKIKLLKNMKLNDKKLTHLANTTIHIGDYYVLPHGLVEHAALISFNTQGMGTKIVLHQPYLPFNSEYWDSFMSEKGLTNSNIQVEMPASYVVFDEVKKICERLNGNEKQNIVVFYSPSLLIPASSQEINPEENFHRLCKDKIGSSTHNRVFKYYDSKHDLVENFMGDLLDINLFLNKN